MVKTQVEEKMDEIIPGLMPLFSAYMNEYMSATLIRSSIIPLEHDPANLGQLQPSLVAYSAKSSTYTGPSFSTSYLIEPSGDTFWTFGAPPSFCASSSSSSTKNNS